MTAEASLQALHIAAHLDAIERRIAPALGGGDRRCCRLTATGGQPGCTASWPASTGGCWKASLMSSKICLGAGEARPLYSWSAAKLPRWNGPEQTAPLLAGSAAGVRPPCVTRRIPSSRLRPRKQRDAGRIAWQHAVQECVCRSSRPRSRPRPRAPRTNPLGDGGLFEEGESKDGPGSGPLLLRHLLPVRPTVVFDTYWKFAAERQRIFFRRLEGPPAAPGTADPILGRF